MNLSSRPRSIRASAASPLPRRHFLKLTAAGLAGWQLSGFLSRAGAQVAAPGARQTTWGMNTNIDVWPLYADSVEEAIAHVGPLLLETGCTLVREGMQGDMNGDNLDPINWGRWFDAWVDWLDAHGMQMVLQLNLNQVRHPGFIYDAEWEKRVIHKCREAATYIAADPKRRRVVRWVMLINEPDLKTGRSGGFITPERLVRYHELAWNTIKPIAPDLLIEGLSFGDAAGIGAAFPLRAFNLNTADERGGQKPPTAGESVPGLVVQDVLNLGITRYCDLIGFHSYLEISEDNPYGARALTRHMAAAHEKSGYPIRPIVNTETGPHDTQFNQKRAAERTGRRPVDVSYEARNVALAHWQAFNRVQQARWGVSRSVYYLLSGSPGAPWMHLAEYPMKQPPHPPPHAIMFPFAGPPYGKRECFATAVAALQAKPLATLNGGFELPEDKYSNWLVCYTPHDFHSDDFTYGEWKETHFLQDGKRTAPGSSGSGYLRFDAGLPKQVRRVVEGLESGRTYRVSAWVRQDAAAKATLAVYGFDQTAPGCEMMAVTAKAGEWVQLSVEFTPRRSVAGADCWGVVSLEHGGETISYWDDVAVT